MASEYSRLAAQLADCRIKDKFRLKQRLQKLKNNPEQAEQQLLAQAIELSCQKVEQLRNQPTDITYPDLPISQRREEIAVAIQQHQVIILGGETGSGKTTQLPKICLELGFGCKGIIGHTQPRRLAARAVAGRLAEELNVALGSRVGYQVRFQEQTSDASQIKIMTDGILLTEIRQDPFLNSYEVIIIDEAHERSLNIDFLLGYIKRLLPARPDLKLIITSATIDLARFSEHFNSAPVIEVSGRSWQVDIWYRPLQQQKTEQTSDEMQQGILDAAAELLQWEQTKSAGKRGDILVFLSGEADIRETADNLRKSNLKNIEILPLYARLSMAEQKRVFQPDSRKAGTRIVLATNVAETSLTVPGIKYVIDTGTARISRYSYRSKVQRLPIEAISQASANQRAGRCGRISAGICIRLYAEDDFNLRPEFTDPEIQRTNLAAVILQMLSLKLGEINNFPFIEPPDNTLINDGFKLLQQLDAVNEQYRLTPSGKQLARLPIDPRLGRMLLESAKNNCLKEILIILSALSIQEPRERPQNKRQASDQAHQQYTDEKSDFITWVNLWNHYENQRQTLSQNQLRKYCKKAFLSWTRMREWRETHRQLYLSCKQLSKKDQRFIQRPETASYAAIHKTLLTGLLDNIGLQQEKKIYLGARNRKFQIFPGSALYKKPPKWLIAAELIETNQIYARCIAGIDPSWLERPAKKLIKKSWSEPHWEKKRAEIIAFEQVRLYGLLIVPKRKISFNRIEPATAHQLFIYHALVAGQLQTKAPFIKKNQALLQQIEALEAKSRRHDLLVDQDKLTTFYQKQFKTLNASHITTGKEFEHWWQQLKPADQAKLLMHKNDIVQRPTDHIAEQQYPNKLKLTNNNLKLSYRFALGSSADGVSLYLPLSLLTSVSAHRLEWLVPGMIREKCTALIKGLPKSERKHFVPVPDYVTAFLEAVPFGEGNLYALLAKHLLRMTGIKISEPQLRQIKLPDHLQMNIYLIDAAGNTIQSSRQLALLQQKYSGHMTQQLEQKTELLWGRTGLTTWDFDELETKQLIQENSNTEIQAYPALEDQGDSVRLCLKPQIRLAQACTLKATVRLALLNLSDQLRQINKANSNQLNRIALLSCGLFQPAKLKQQLIWQSCRHLLELDQQLIRSQQAFNQKLAKCQAQLQTDYNQQLNATDSLMQSYQRITKQLKQQVKLKEVKILNDIKLQLSLLFTKDFLTDNSRSQLQQYPRYLQAIEQRLEKFRRNLRQQTLLSAQLESYYHQYQQQIQQQSGQASPALSQYRWLLEEYRVSIFAQNLGTKQKVSEKRLNQQWQQVLIDSQ